MSQVTNFHRLLEKNNVDVDIMTSGKYKRTVSMFGEITDEGREKFKEELEDTHTLFKDFVSENRPQLDIEAIATGEHWFGRRAQEKALVDELLTSDEYLVRRSKDADLYHVKYEIKKNLADRFGLAAQAALEKTLLNGLKVLQNRFYS